MENKIRNPHGNLIIRPTTTTQVKLPALSGHQKSHRNDRIRRMNTSPLDNMPMSHILEVIHETEPLRAVFPNNNYLTNNNIASHVHGSSSSSFGRPSAGICLRHRRGAEERRKMAILEAQLTGINNRLIRVIHDKEKNHVPAACNLAHYGSSLPAAGYRADPRRPMATSCLMSAGPHNQLQPPANIGFMDVKNPATCSRYHPYNYMVANGGRVVHGNMPRRPHGAVHREKSLAFDAIGGMDQRTASSSKYDHNKPIANAGAGDQIDDAVDLTLKL
ncbi:hypothetical protein Dimus_001865 [Dionaea muscipula]